MQSYNKRKELNKDMPKKKLGRKRTIILDNIIPLETQDNRKKRGRKPKPIL